MKRYNRQSGVTLPEMMTAVAITLIMLASSGMIFSSASKSSGKAMALNDMMKDVRAISGQLEKDFSGLRGDLPLAFIFEGVNFTDYQGNTTLERRDRMVFFTNGDFVDIDNHYSSNTARIFYGQSLDGCYDKDGNGSLDDYERLDQTIDSVGIAPNRRILARRMKLTSPTRFLDFNSDKIIDETLALGPYESYWPNSYLYDMQGIDYAPDYFWKMDDLGGSGGTYFSSWFNAYPSPALPGQTPVGAKTSFLRRPDFENAKNNFLDYADYYQRMLVSSDVTDFKIQLYVLVWDDINGDTLATSDEYVYRWYPRNDDLYRKQSNGLPEPALGLYWNVYWDYKDPATLAANISCDSVIYNNGTIGGAITLMDHRVVTASNMPRAIKVSFKLYDKNRTHFPEGKLFEYVYKVPNTD